MSSLLKREIGVIIYENQPRECIIMGITPLNTNITLENPNVQ